MKRRLGLAALTMMILALAACRGGAGGGGTDGTGGGVTGGGGGGGPLVPVTPSYTQFRSVKVCEEIPQEKIEEIVGAEVSRPAEEYTVESRDVACYYPFGRRDGKAVFVFVSVGPTLMYSFNREANVEMLPDAGLGDEAYIRTQTAHKELWVLLNGRASVIIGMFDFDIEQASEIAKLAIPIAPEE